MDISSMKGFTRMFIRGKTRLGGYHINGGGFIEDGARVDPRTYLGPMAKVLDKAVIEGANTITGQVIIADEVEIKNTAPIIGNPYSATEGATIGHHAIIEDFVQIEGGRIGGYSVIQDEAKIEDTIIEDGSVRISKDIEVGEVELGYYDSEPCDRQCNTSDNEL